MDQITVKRWELLRKLGMESCFNICFIELNYYISCFFRGHKDNGCKQLPFVSLSIIPLIV